MERGLLFALISYKKLVDSSKLVLATIDKKGTIPFFDKARFVTYSASLGTVGKLKPLLSG
ncbi:MAG: hypothetical protein COA78_01900 [Blastopirellula sp.]|nr:MAG: hypothetical protein COA78_01900 [Blastopirellula sp.]